MSTGNDSPDRLGNLGQGVRSIVLSVLAGLGLCFPYVYVELFLNSRWHEHVYGYRYLYFIFQYHTPIFVFFGILGGLVCLLPKRGGGRRLVSEGAVIVASLLAANLAGDAFFHRFLTGGAARGNSILVGFIVGILGIICCWGISLLLRRVFPKRDILIWGYLIALVVACTWVLRAADRDERSFFNVVSLSMNLLRTFAVTAFFIVLALLLRRPVILWAVTIVVPILLTPTWIKSGRRSGSVAEARKDLPNVVLVCIDTLRADRMSLYGYERETTPVLKELSKGGAVFENCIAASNWTKPSTASLLTSTEPSVHGATKNESRLSGELLTAAEIFRATGYRTIGIVANHQLKSLFGFDQGFDVYFEPRGRGMNYLTMMAKTGIDPFFRPIRTILPADSSRHVGVSAENLRQAALKHVTGKEEPFFIYLHFMDPHSPYDSPPEYDRVFNPELLHKYSYDDLDRDPKNFPEEGMRELEIRYLGAVLYVDATLGKLFKDIDGLGSKRPTLVAVTADHGEAFGDHGDYGHGHSLYEENIRIPLMIWGPGIPSGVRLEKPVSLIDVVPTLLDVSGIKIPEQIRGRSLLPDVLGKESPKKVDFVFSEKVGVHSCLRGDGWKYIETDANSVDEVGTVYNVHKKAEEYFNLKEDPKELKVLGDADGVDTTDKSKALGAILRFLESISYKRQTTEIDEDTANDLRGLGYL